MYELHFHVHLTENVADTVDKITANGYKKAMKNLSLIISYIVLFVCGCSLQLPKTFESTESVPHIEPDYAPLEIPPNIAPLNFTIKEPGSIFYTEITGKGGEPLLVSGKTIDIPVKRWKTLLTQNKGGEIRFTVFVQQEGKWKKYAPLVNKVSDDPIAPYLTYRLIEPGYEGFYRMTLEERCMENFEQKTFFDNGKNVQSAGLCVNCHCSQNGKAEQTMFHIRATNKEFISLSGTVFFQNNKYSKVNLKPVKHRLPCVYPSWHPNQPLLAFTTSDILQFFHTRNLDKIVVAEEAADLALYDTEKKTLVPILETENEIESFPNWSHDGKYLYYVSSPSPLLLPKNKDLKQIGRSWSKQCYEDFHYNLMRIPFDETSRRFGKPELLVDAVKENKSVTFPRIAPDGRYMLYSLCNYGCFSIWHRESDLYLLDLQTGKSRAVTELNSGASESFHNWTADGKWVVFTSRRDDGSYTRLYFAHFQDGVFSKPFLLPQREPAQNQRLFKSYNTPELIAEPVRYQFRDIVRIVDTDSIPAKYEY